MERLGNLVECLEKDIPHFSDERVLMNLYRIKLDEILKSIEGVGSEEIEKIRLEFDLTVARVLREVELGSGLNDFTEYVIGHYLEGRNRRFISW